MKYVYMKKNKLTGRLFLKFTFKQMNFVTDELILSFWGLICYKSYVITEEEVWI